MTVKKDISCISILDSVEGDIVTISSDGTVTIHKEGSEPEAARSFWGAVQSEGRSINKDLEKYKRECLEWREWFEKLKRDFSGVYGEEYPVNYWSDWGELKKNIPWPGSRLKKGK